MSEQHRDEYSKLTEQIIGLCFEIHKELGPGFTEKIYASALRASLRRHGVKFEYEREFDVSCANDDVGVYRADLVVNNKVIVEVKAVTGRLPKIFEQKLIAYLKASKLPVGLLINFGNSSCQIRRLMNRFHCNQP